MSVSLTSEAQALFATLRQLADPEMAGAIEVAVNEIP